MMRDATGQSERLDSYLTHALPSLASWMDAQRLSGGSIDAEPIGGGTQNLLLRLRRGGQRYVLRRCSLRAEDPQGTAMGRESRVLGALRATAVPHPRLIASCSDAAVIGASFLLMADVDGFCPRFGLPEDFHADAERVHRMGLAVVDAIVELSRVDHVDVGLADLGTEGWLERQVRRWAGQLSRYKDIDGYDGTRLPESAAVGAWLEANRPAQSRLGILHGDFHLANALIDHGTPAVAAIVDWELATIGDPLLDLGHLLVTWPKGGIGPAELAQYALPEREELVEHYLAGTHRSPEKVRWFEVLAGYRLAIILEGTQARARAGKAPAEVGERLHRLAEALMRSAWNTVEKQG